MLEIPSINTAVKEALDWDSACLGVCLYPITNCLQHLGCLGSISLSVKLQGKEDEWLLSIVFST